MSKAEPQITEKWHIVGKKSDRPWGGGASFLFLLERELRSRGLLADGLEDSDVILLNLTPGTYWPIIRDLSSKLHLLSRKKIISRVDGPVSLTSNNMRRKVYDYLLHRFSEEISDVVIYQSEWSRKRYFSLFGQIDTPSVVIHNGASTDLIEGSRLKASDGKVRIINSSWSSNCLKEYATMDWLSEQVNHDAFSFFFFGNPPYHSPRIKNRGVLTKDELKAELLSASVFLAPSRNESCSNSMVEALAAGCDVIALNHGGHPEIVKKSDLLYSSKSELLRIILDFRPTQVSRDARSYFSVIRAADEYVSLGQTISPRATRKAPPQRTLRRLRLIEKFQNSIEPALNRYGGKPGKFFRAKVRSLAPELALSPNSPTTSALTRENEEPIIREIDGYIEQSTWCDGLGTPKFVPTGSIGKEADRFALLIRNLWAIHKTGISLNLEASCPSNLIVAEFLGNPRTLSYDRLHLRAPNLDRRQLESKLALTNKSGHLSKTSDFQDTKAYSISSLLYQVRLSQYLLGEQLQLGHQISKQIQSFARKIASSHISDLRSAWNGLILLEITEHHAEISQDTAESLIGFFNSSQKTLLPPSDDLLVLSYLAPTIGKRTRSELQAHLEKIKDDLVKRYWEGLGGFSSFSASSQTHFQGRRITYGYAEPDMQASLYARQLLLTLSKLRSH